MPPVNPPVVVIEEPTFDQVCDKLKALAEQKRVFMPYIFSKQKDFCEITLNNNQEEQDAWQVFNETVPASMALTYQMRNNSNLIVENSRLFKVEAHANNTDKAKLNFTQDISNLTNLTNLKNFFMKNMIENSELSTERSDGDPRALTYTYLGRYAKDYQDIQPLDILKPRLAKLISDLNVWNYPADLF